MADLVERLLDPDMPVQELYLHMGQMTAQERRTARAAIRWANTRLRAALEAEASKGERRGLERVLNMQAPIDSMCMTYRHDFGLPKVMNSYGNGISGMTERDRDALRLTMRQIWEHAVLHSIRALIPEAPVREVE